MPPRTLAALTWNGKSPREEEVEARRAELEGLLKAAGLEAVEGPVHVWQCEWRGGWVGRRAHARHPPPRSARTASSRPPHHPTNPRRPPALCPQLHARERGAVGDQGGRRGGGGGGAVRVTRRWWWAARQWPAVPPPPAAHPPHAFVCVAVLVSPVTSQCLPALCCWGGSGGGVHALASTPPTHALEAPCCERPTRRSFLRRRPALAAKAHKTLTLPLPPPRCHHTTPAAITTHRHGAGAEAGQGPPAAWARKRRSRRCR